MEVFDIYVYKHLIFINSSAIPGQAFLLFIVANIFFFTIVTIVALTQRTDKNIW
jgi:hypothetical protein